MSELSPTQAVIEHLKSLAIEMSQPGIDVASRREIIDRYFALAPEVMAQTIKPKPVMVGNCKAYWFVPNGHKGNRRMLYIHGGSWMSGSVKGWGAFVARIAQASNCALLFIEYSLMPEHPFPAGLNDCLQAFDWLQTHGPENNSQTHKIFLAGDSAGGNLALACLLALKESNKKMPEAALAISPCTDFSGSGESMQTRAGQDPIIRPEAIALLPTVYLQNGEDLKTPLASPLFGDLSGLPPIMLQTGEAEVLLDDSIRFAKKAQQAGAEVVLDTWPDMPHVFQGFAPFLPEANLALRRIAEFFESASR